MSNHTFSYIIVISINYSYHYEMIIKIPFFCLSILFIISYSSTEFLIRFEDRGELARLWLVCEPLRIHLEPINKELMLLVTI